jgi:hypothetical protein
MVRELKKRNKDGVLYKRPEAIESLIEVALQQDLERLHRRAWLTERQGGEFLPMECLVHLIRDALRRGERSLFDALLRPLLARAEQMLKAKIPDTGLPNAADIRENILSDFSFLFVEDCHDEQKNELDYFECRFNSAFACFRIDFLRRESTRSKNLEQFPANDEGAGVDSDERSVKSQEVEWSVPATQVQTIFGKERLKAIVGLPEEERKVVILCGVLGFKEESEDPTIVTAATLCGVTGRTIRNRLKRAAAKLSNFREDV